MRDIVRLGLILMIVCGVAAGSLAWVYQTTKPVIETRKQEELNAALKIVMKDADAFEPVRKDGKTVYLAKKGGKEVGVAIPVESKGYGSTPISMLVGIDMDGKVVKVKVLSHGETAGLGSRIENDSFTDQFAGKSAKDPLEVKRDVDALSGATISSKGVTNGVKNALTLFGEMFGGKKS